MKRGPDKRSVEPCAHALRGRYLAASDSMEIHSYRVTIAFEGCYRIWDVVAAAARHAYAWS
jgi:hypothetical protein